MKRISKSRYLLPVIAMSIIIAAGEAGAVTFGNASEDGNSYGQADTMYATRFLCGESGNINRIHAYFYRNPSYGGNARVAVYSDSGGHPAFLLAQSGSQAVQKGTNWNEFVIPDTSVTTSTYYWLVFQFDTDYCTGYYRFSGTVDYRGYTYSAFPNSFGTPDGNYNITYDIYATEIATPTVTVTATRSPTRTPTSTRTPLPTRTATRTPVFSPTGTPTIWLSITPTQTVTAVPTFQAPATPTRTPVPAAAPGADQLLAYPNPARSGTVTFSFQSAGAGEARFEIYNSAYRSVTAFSRSVSGAGPQQVNWDISGLAPGVYLCRVTLSPGAGGKALPAAKLVVAR